MPGRRRIVAEMLSHGTHQSSEASVKLKSTRRDVDMYYRALIMKLQAENSHVVGPCNYILHITAVEWIYGQF